MTEARRTGADCSTQQLSCHHCPGCPQNHVVCFVIWYQDCLFMDCFLPVQNATSDLNDTVVQFKTSALSEMKPAWEDVQRAADSFANTSLAVASRGVSGAVRFGDERWTALQAAPGPAAALAPVSAPSQVAVTDLSLIAQSCRAFPSAPVGACCHQCRQTSLRTLCCGHAVLQRAERRGRCL